jgi:hypothetical protein
MKKYERINNYNYLKLEIQKEKGYLIAHSLNL